MPRLLASLPRRAIPTTQWVLVTLTAIACGGETTGRIDQTTGGTTGGSAGSGAVAAATGGQGGSGGAAASGGGSAGQGGLSAGAGGTSTAGSGGGSLVGNEDLGVCGAMFLTQTAICTQHCYVDPSQCAAPYTVCCAPHCSRGAVNDWNHISQKGNGAGCVEPEDCTANGAVVAPLPFCK
jgi:hypothetical protein